MPVTPDGSHRRNGCQVPKPLPPEIIKCPVGNGPETGDIYRIGLLIDLSVKRIAYFSGA